MLWCFYIFFSTLHWTKEVQNMEPKGILSFLQYSIKRHLHSSWNNSAVFCTCFVFDAPWSIGHISKNYCLLPSSSLWGPGSRRRTQLPKCVHSPPHHSGIHYSNTQLRGITPVLCVSCMHHVSLQRHVGLLKLFCTSLRVPNMHYTSPMCEGIARLASASAEPRWFISHGDFIMWPPNDRHSACCCCVSVAIPKDHIKHVSFRGMEPAVDTLIVHENTHTHKL